MARTVAELPKGARITDYISLGVISKTFPLGKVREILAETGRESARRRDLPAHVVVYYVIALALYMQSSYREVLRCLLEGLQWLKAPGTRVNVAGKSGISQARTRLGSAPVKALHDQVVKPIAVKGTKGAWYRRWLLVSLDGSAMDVADTPANAAAFGRPGASRGKSAYPQVRFCIPVGERHPRSVRDPSGAVWHGRDHPGQGRRRQSRGGHVVPCRPQFPWLRAVGTGAGEESGFAVEREKEPGPAL